MKVLEVNGDDFAAATFEQSKYSVNQMIKIIENKEEFPEELCWINFKIHNFGDVDPKFIKFVKKFIDYDYGKMHNFYLEGNENE